MNSVSNVPNTLFDVESRVTYSEESNGGRFWPGQALWISGLIETIPADKFPEIWPQVLTIADSIRLAYLNLSMRDCALWPKEVINNPGLLLEPMMAGNLSPFCLSGGVSYFSTKGLGIYYNMIGQQASQAAQFPANHLTQYLIAIAENFSVDLSDLEPINRRAREIQIMTSVDESWANTKFMPGDLFMFIAHEAYQDPMAERALSVELLQEFARVESETGFAPYKRHPEFKAGIVIDFENLSSVEIDRIRAAVATLNGDNPESLENSDIVVIDLLLATGRAAGPLTNFAKNYPGSKKIGKRHTVLYRNIIDWTVPELRSIAETLNFSDISDDDLKRNLYAILVGHEESHGHNPITFSSSLEETRAILQGFIGAAQGLGCKDLEPLISTYIAYLLRYENNYQKWLSTNPTSRSSHVDYHESVALILGWLNKNSAITVHEDKSLLIDTTKFLESTLSLSGLLVETATAGKDIHGLTRLHDTEIVHRIAYA